MTSRCVTTITYVPNKNKANLSLGMALSSLLFVKLNITNLQPAVHEMKGYLVCR